MRDVPLKVYAAFYPVEANIACALEALAPQVIGSEPFVFFEGDMVRVAYEGVYFPVEDAMELFKSLLPPLAQGKCDVLDIDAWTLTRHELLHGEWKVSTRSLNHVLDYSGH